MSLISLKDVWLKYRIQFKEDGGNSYEDFWAVKGINIDINKGEVFGIIGENGAGKTTLLNIIAGMLKPDRGTVEISGTVSAIMEIGAGFQKDLTGKENIYLTSSLFGLTNEEISAKYDDIIKFAGIGRFIHAPVRVYSTGMYMRLAFAIAIHVDPDILLIDETFAVGDIYAQYKCINKVFELKEQGKTIIFISQDIEMSKRLCTRGIFIRDGVIIKEGPIDKLCTYYMESVGDKKGIAIVQKGQIGAIFNNGKLVLRCEDRAVTCGLAGHAIMSSLDREYSSTTATWQVQKPATDKEIVAIGTWPDLNVSEYWRIVFLNEREFIWEIVIDVIEETFIERFTALAIFIDEYKSWFTLEDKTDFPDKFAHLLEWEYTTIDDSANRVIGFKGDNNLKESLPAIIFDRVQDNTNMSCRVGNTGSDIRGRAITCQYVPEHLGKIYNKGKYRCFSAKVKVLEENEKNELKFYLDNTRKIIQESKIIRKGLLSLFCMENKVEIYWQDRLITSGIGLDTKFRCQEKYYCAHDGHWNINKENNDQIVITISWDDSPGFIQIWKLRLRDDSTLLWEIDMDISDKIKIRNKDAELILDKEYDKWITPDERGDFSRLSRQGNAVVLNKYINNCIGVEKAFNNGFVLPRLLFRHNGSLPATSYLFRIDEKESSTKLRYLEIDYKENFYTPAGMHKYFNGELKVTANKEITERPMEASEKNSDVINHNAGSLAEIKYNKTSLVFDHGKARIFWNGLELTKGLGLYSSVMAAGMWYDSSQAFWEIRKLEKGKLVVMGHWPGISMAQSWSFSIINEKTILWNIEKAAWEDVRLDKEQVNLMLSDTYKEWFTNKHVHGKFPERFSGHNGFFWDRLWCGAATSTVGVKRAKFKKGIFSRGTLPSLIFGFSPHCQARYCVIENTDDLFQSRVLQCELGAGEAMDSEKNVYFDGQIRIASQGLLA
ncbi:MAG: ABC transporter ATP-binding protein [Candidatus Omnitrophica bacterium]|nr:ABC transporter ATP-binding protein [Candidatus Omnitrophota bacterium]